MFWVCFGLYMDVLSVSMRFSVIFCIYEHIQKYICGFFENLDVSKFEYCLYQNGPKWFLPHPHPRRQQKSPVRGQKMKIIITLSMTFYDFYEKKKNTGGLKRGS